MLLCGGGSRVPGLSAKFAAEMQSVSPPSLQPAMCSCPDYMPEKTLHYSSWMGAAILSKVRVTHGTLAGGQLSECLAHATYMEKPRAGPYDARVYRKSVPKIVVDGNMLLQLVFQQNQHITKLDYEEAGPTVVHKKCC